MALCKNFKRRRTFQTFHLQNGQSGLKSALGEGQDLFRAGNKIMKDDSFLIFIQSTPLIADTLRTVV